MVAHHSSPLLILGNAWKAAEEDVVGAYVTDAAPIAAEPSAVPETGDHSDTGAEAYNFKEYVLNEYDLGDVDNRLYEYGAYDEYGLAPPKPTTAYEDEVGPGVAAETDVSESTVSITPRLCWPRGVCMKGPHQGLCPPVHALLVGCLSWDTCGVSKCIVCDFWFNDWQLSWGQCMHLGVTDILFASFHSSREAQEWFTLLFSFFLTTYYPHTHILYLISVCRPNLQPSQTHPTSPTPLVYTSILTTWQPSLPTLQLSYNS